MENKEQKNKFWSFVERFEGDKVVLMIMLLLMMLSILSISSSTSLLATMNNTNRLSIIGEQLLIVLGGLFLVFLCYIIKSIRFFRILSQFGFAISLFMLLFLAFKIDLGVIRVASTNAARRAIMVFGFQLHVYEVVKVAMVMYLAWAVNELKNGGFSFAGWLSEKENFRFMGNLEIQKLFYIYFPIIIITVLILLGGFSSAMFTFVIMMATIVLGGINFKKIIVPAILIGILVGGMVFGVYRLSNGKIFSRLATAESRLKSQDRYLDILEEGKTWTEEYRYALGKLKQPESAKIAIKEGKFIGKGPGGSTQRYVVPIMFGDYMFSFIVEEYGLIGAILVIILYGSLLSRGSIIVRNCTNHFAKTAIAGLTILISGQALMHIFINIDIGPHTGQTLPLISHGNTSFLAFSIAFGIILTISRMAAKKIADETKNTAPLMQDDIKERMDDLDMVESIDD